MVLPDPPAAARSAGLRHVSDSAPGFSRRRRAQGFTYLTPSGSPLKDRSQLRRIRSLAIPPAWKDVWICPLPTGHLQATGLDNRGRKQYLYHPGWTAHSNRDKFDTLADFGAALPAIRNRIDRDLRLPGLPKDKVSACILHLMDRTLIRVGNSEYARDNESYGLTTILNRHARVAGATVRFRFKAKSGRTCDASIDDPRAARIVRACQDLPGQELFCYRDASGAVRDIGSSDVNDYLAAIASQPFTAKDFRTWGGTCAAAQALFQLGPPRRRDGSPLPAADLKHRQMAALRAAAHALGNTVAICRKFYIHPDLFDAYTSGRLHAAFHRADHARSRRLSLTERALLLLLKPAAIRKAAA